MLIASIVNVGESLYFINITNTSCYNSYIYNRNEDIMIFCAIRFVSHYLFMLACLFIFRIQRLSHVKSIIVSDSEKSILIASYYEDDPFEDFTNHLRINVSKNLKEKK